jgi:hypothetical protein
MNLDGRSVAASDERLAAHPSSLSKRVPLSSRLCGKESTPFVLDSHSPMTQGISTPSLMPWIFFLSAGTRVAKQPPK